MDESKDGNDVPQMQTPLFVGAAGAEPESVPTLQVSHGCAESRAPMRLQWDRLRKEVVDIEGSDPYANASYWRDPSPEEAYQAGRASKAAEILEVLVREEGRKP